MFQPMAMGSLNYKQRHNHFSDNGNLEEFVSVHQQCHTYTVACTLKLKLGIPANRGVL